MCGRYASARAADDLAGIYDARLDAEVAPDYNVAPTATVPTVVQPGGAGAPAERLLTAATWGFSRSASTSAVVINARTETLTERGLVAGSLRHRRCLLPADGWDEWVRGGGPPQPYFVAPVDGAVLSLAGLWRPVPAPDGEATLRVVVITGAASEPLRWLHDRTPMIVPAAGWDAWLDPSTRSDPRDLLVPATAAAVTARRVGRAVNSVANNGPALTAGVADPAADTLF